MIYDYISGRKEGDLLPVAVIMSAFLGGYTVSDFPQQFLQLFVHPIMQFLVFLTLLYLFYSSQGIIWKKLIFDACAIVLFIQLLKFILTNYYYYMNR